MCLVRSLTCAACHALQDLAQAYQGGDDAVATVIAQSVAKQQAITEMRRLRQAVELMQKEP